MMQLNEQTVLITGASRGLGAAIAEAFANEGANVIINYFKSKQKAEALVDRLGDKAIAVQADIRDKNQVDEMVDRAVSHFGTPLSTIINNALVDFRFDPKAQKNAAELEWDNFQTQIEGTVKGSVERRAGRSGLYEGTWVWTNHQHRYQPAAKPCSCLS